MRDGILIVTLIVLCAAGCSNEDRDMTERHAAYDAFARQAYDAIVREDLDAMIGLCAMPGDVDLAGEPLVPVTWTAAGGFGLRDQYAALIDGFLEDLDAAGGLSTLEFVRVGKPIGLMSAESEFVGNMFVIVKVGGEEMAIEIGSTQLSRDRGRLIIGGAPFMLKKMDYYNELASVF